MTLYKLKSDLRMTADLILSLYLVKWLLRWLAVNGNRIKQLSKQTATIVHHICIGIVSLCRHILATGHKYELYWEFTTDALKYFLKLHQGSSGTYFMNVQECIEKLHIKLFFTFE